jgi:hypothetical protein
LNALWFAGSFPLHCHSFSQKGKKKIVLFGLLTIQTLASFVVKSICRRDILTETVPYPSDGIRDARMLGQQPRLEPRAGFREQAGTTYPSKACCGSSGMESARRAIIA